MTREEAISKFREMWNWLAENYNVDLTVTENKYNAIEELFGDIYVNNNCFLCEYTDDMFDMKADECDSICDLCPISFTSNPIFTNVLNMVRPIKCFRLSMVMKILQKNFVSRTQNFLKETRSNNK